MPYLYLIISILCAAAASVMGAFYNSKTNGKRDAAPLYNLIYGISVLTGWIILFISEPSFDVGVIPYSVGFGTCYIICEFGFVKALRTGSISLTTLILNLALIATTVWGFFFWDTKFTWLIGIGLVLVVIAIWLCLYTGKEKNAAKITPKWIIYSLMAFGGNAGCAIIQRSQQIAFDGKHGNMLMLGGISMAVVFFIIMYLRSNKSDSLFILKKATPFPIISGVGNLLLNVIIIVLTRFPKETPPSIIYPSLAIGSLSITGICSLLIFKEKLKLSQWIGIGIGAIAVALLSL